MRRCLLTATLFLSALFPVLVAAQTEIMPVEQIQPGMTGTVRTTLQGTEVEEVDAEVLGVLQNYLGPNLHLILVKLTGEQVRFQGVANGMSGSPLYIGGRLAGALSTRIGYFAKEPIAGVTPIGDMLSTQFGARGKPQVSMDYQQLWSGNEAVERLARQLGRPIEKPIISQATHSTQVTSRPIGLTLSHSGLHPSLVNRYDSFFREIGVELTKAGTLSGGPVQIEGPLEPGMPVMVKLMSGDLELGASGTLTHVDDNKVWAFGHPFFQLGQVEWPLARAEVVKVFPSIDGSFNITNSGQEIGAIIQDRSVAVYGILGRQASLIPMEVVVKHGGSEVAGYKYRLIRDVLLTPLLIEIAVGQSLAVTQRLSGELSVALSGTFTLDGYEEIVVENLFSGFNVLSELGMLPAAVYFYLGNNEFAPVSVSAISVELDLVEEQRLANLEKAWFTKTSDVKPGDQFKLIMELKPRRGKDFRLEQDYVIPSTLQSGDYKVTVGNGAAITEQENALIKGTFKIRDLRHMIRLINSLRPNFKLYAQVFREEEGYYFDGDFFPSLPPSDLSVMRANKGDDNLVRLLGTVLDERRMDTEYYVQGVRKLRFTVKR